MQHMKKSGIIVSPILTSTNMLSIYMLKKKKKLQKNKVLIFVKVIGNLNVSPVEYRVLVFTVTFHSGVIKFRCRETSCAQVWNIVWEKGIQSKLLWCPADCSYKNTTKQQIMWDVSDQSARMPEQYDLTSWQPFFAVWREGPWCHDRRPAQYYVQRM